MVALVRVWDHGIVQRVVQHESKGAHLPRHVHHLGQLMTLREGCVVWGRMGGDGMALGCPATGPALAALQLRSKRLATSSADAIA